MVAIVLGLAIGYWERSGRYIGEWPWWSVFIILMVGVIVVVVSGTRVLRELLTRYREQRFLTALRADEQQVPGEVIEDDQRLLREKIQEAIRTLQQSPDLRKKGGLPLYAVPWYLLIGANQSGKTTLLQ